MLWQGHLDLSFPKGESVNSGISKECLDAAKFKLRLPSPMDLGRAMRAIGTECMLYKVDLSCACRQLRGDPLDRPLMGILWEDEFFVDLAIPFGLRHGASACQRVSVAAGKIAAHEADTRTEAYVDDTGGVAMGTVADEHYRNILRVMEELGLQFVPDKCSPPAYWMIWIGVLFKARNMTMAIDPERIREAIEACRAFLEASTISLHGLQCYLGKLFHAIKCTESARAFMARILDLLRLAIREGTVAVSDLAKMDAAWWCSVSGQIQWDHHSETGCS